MLKFVFVVGVEGCGHHGLIPVISSALKHSHNKDNNVVACYHDKRFLKYLFDWYFYAKPLKFTRPLVKIIINCFFRIARHKSYKNNQIRFIIEDNSFPSGNNRDPNKQWNIIEMMKVIRPCVDEIYLIGLYRDPIAATFSHPNWDGGMIPHAKVLKNCLTYINDQLEQLKDLPQVFIHYEDLIYGQDKLGPLLANFLCIDETDMIEGFNKIRQSKKNWQHDMNLDDQKRMTDIFTNEVATAQWPLFSTATKFSKKNNKVSMD